MIHISQATGIQSYKQIHLLAHQIWPQTFADMLSSEQITYMLETMYSLESLKEQIESKGQIFLLAQEEGEYLGFVSYELHYQGLACTKLHKLYLLPASQGRGLGKKLIELVTEKALQSKDKKLSLNVNRYNNAFLFYEKIGFIKVKEENISIGNGYWMEDFVMEKALAT